jgi:hypothetical protein
MIKGTLVIIQYLVRLPHTAVVQVQDIMELRLEEMAAVVAAVVQVIPAQVVFRAG